MYLRNLIREIAETGRYCEGHKFGHKHQAECLNNVRWFRDCAHPESVQCIYYVHSSTEFRI